MASNASAQLTAIAAACRTQANGKAIKRKMTVGIRAAAQPLKTSVKGAAASQLPKRGGLAARVSGERVTVSVLTGPRTAGARMLMRNHDAKATNDGRVRHPVPNTGQWVEQSIPKAAGWWTDTLKRESPAVTPAVLAVMGEIAAEIRAA